MKKYKGFSDLCIPFETHESLRNIFTEAVELGYQNVAIEQFVDFTRPDILKKDDPVPKPIDLASYRGAFCNDLRLLNRLTIVLTGPPVSWKMSKSAKLNQYDLIAALPITEPALAYACTDMECDIITYDSTNRQTLKMNRKLYFQAVARNIAFEIKYSPGLVCHDTFLATITRAHGYHFFGKSKNLLISSGAKASIDLRSPYDVANLGFIFGLNEKQSMQAIRDTPNKLLLISETRRNGKTGIVLRKRTTLDDSDDYTDTELNEEISDVDDAAEAMDVGPNTNADDTIELEPPEKKMKS